MRRVLALLLLLGCAPAARSAPLGPEDARGPIAMVRAGDSIEIAWTAGAPLHVVTATLDASGLDGAVREQWVGRSSAEPALAATDDAVILAFRASTPEGDVVMQVERHGSSSFEAALPRDQVSFAPTAYQPALITSSDGTVVLAFDQWTSTGYGVSLATRDRAGVWTRARDAEDVVSPRVFHSNAPRLAAGPSGAVLLTWYQSLGGPLLVHARERDVAGRFVSTAPDGVVSLRDRPVGSHPIANPRPALGPAGQAALAWTAEAGAEVRVYVATRGPDAAWVLPRDVDDALSLRGHAACVQPLFLPNGELVVVWQVDEGEGWSVVGAQRSGGVFGPPTVLFTEAYEPALTVAGEELVVVATQLEDPPRVVLRRGPSIAALGAPLSVSETSEPASAPSVLALGDEVFVAYLAGTAFSSRVRVARLE